MNEFFSDDDYSPKTIDDVINESELPPFVDDTTDNNFDDDDEIIAHDMNEYFSNVIKPYLDEWTDDNTSKNGQKKSSLPCLTLPCLAKPRRTFPLRIKNFAIDTRRDSVKIVP